MKLKKVSKNEFYGYLVTLTFIIFVVLKATGVVGWSWWWITSPLWIPAVISVLSTVLIYVLLTLLNRKVKKLGGEIEKDLSGVIDDIINDKQEKN